MTIACRITGSFYCMDCVDQDGSLVQATPEQEVKEDTPADMILPAFWHGCARCGCDLTKGYKGYTGFSRETYQEQHPEKDWAGGES